MSQSKKNDAFEFRVWFSEETGELFFSCQSLLKSFDLLAQADPIGFDKGLDLIQRLQDRYQKNFVPVQHDPNSLH